ncbi:MAG TPA: hypothetical protein VLZ75_00025 [Chitinophagales bacterium]|nr:hypothetical protein [Chitinophagales bacterium]
MLRFLVLILLVSSCSEVKKDRGEELKGNVKSYEEISYKAIGLFGKIVKGNKLRDQNLEGSGMHDLYVVLDKNQNVTERRKYDSDGNLVYKTIYIYDKGGNITEEKERNGGFTNYFYDKNGYLIQQDINHGSGSSQKWIYLNDNKGNKIEMKEFDFYNTLKYTNIYNYDENGNQIEFLEYDKNHDLQSQVIFKYNEIGKKSEIYSSRKSLIMGKYDLYYGTFKSKYTYVYDEKGNVVLEMRYGKTDENETILKLEYFYEYDKIGNWISKTILENDEPQFILERKIDYYN